MDNKLVDPAAWRLVGVRVAKAICRVMEEDGDVECALPKTTREAAPTSILAVPDAWCLVGHRLADAIRHVEDDCPEEELWQQNQQPKQLRTGTQTSCSDAESTCEPSEMSENEADVFCSNDGVPFAATMESQCPGPWKLLGSSIGGPYFKVRAEELEQYSVCHQPDLVDQSAWRSIGCRIAKAISCTADGASMVFGPESRPEARKVCIATLNTVDSASTREPSEMSPSDNEVE